uniref:Ig-like domain-containing protein n=1 Tax=Vombatus ursinus TaxID=29139 RepID=A0A4X2LYU3_VOMUR
MVWLSKMKGRGEKILFALLGILWMQLAWVTGQQLEQSPQSMSMQEGQDFTMSCNSSSTLNTLMWYRQEPGKQPVFLTILVKSKEVRSQGRFIAQFDEKKKQSFLLIKTSQPQDSATYLCAGSHSALQVPTTSTQTLQLGSSNLLVSFPSTLCTVFTLSVSTLKPFTESLPSHSKKHMPDTHGPPFSR